MAFAKVARGQNGKICVNKKSLKTVVQECQLALQQLACGCDDDDDHDVAVAVAVAGELDVSQDSADHSASSIYNTDTAEIYDLLKSRFECDDFKKKLENAQALVPQNRAAEGNSWDMGGTVDLETEDYVLVRQEDVIEGLASLMASYLVSIEQTKDLAPNELQRVFSHFLKVEYEETCLTHSTSSSQDIRHKKEE